MHLSLPRYWQLYAHDAPYLADWAQTVKPCHIVELTVPTKGAVYHAAENALWSYEYTDMVKPWLFVGGVFDCPVSSKRFEGDTLILYCDASIRAWLKGCTPLGIALPQLLVSFHGSDNNGKQIPEPGVPG